MKGGRFGTALALAMVMVIIAATAIGFSVSGGFQAERSNGNETGSPVDWQPEATLDGSLQRFTSYKELENFLSTAPSYPGYWYYSNERGNMLSMADGLTAAAEGSSGYSTTNVQVEGVDEADIVKNDGEYIYLAVDNRLIIVRAHPTEKAQVLYELETEGNIEGLFINGDRLAVIEGQGSLYATWREDSSSSGYQDRTSIMVYDVADRENPTLERQLSVVGYYVSARMIGDYVYFIANGSAWAGEDNVTLPKVYDDETAVDIQPAEIWHSETPDYGYSFTTVMSVNVMDDDEEANHETLLIGNASTIYVSPSNIYVTFPKWSIGSMATHIHRIHIDEGRIEYHAGGEIPGSLLNQFSMDEQGEYLRVATTTGYVSRSGGTTSGNHIYVLDQRLDTVGRLEDLAPGEEIYSARFMGNRCYLVTFKKVDPLFVIDLSDPVQPRVLGEIKITGYSDYLHPYDENHIIGIGKETVAAEEGDFAWYQGVKISLFDVSDLANPREIAKYEIGDRGTDSPVLYDHKAFLFDRSRNLLVLPVSVAEIDEQQYPDGVPSWAYGDTVWQGAYVFDISLNHGLELKGSITHCGDLRNASPRPSTSPWSSYFDWETYSRCSIERSLYIGDVLYTVSGSEIAMNDLETLAKVGEISLD